MSKIQNGSLNRFKMAAKRHFNAQNRVALTLNRPSYHWPFKLINAKCHYDIEHTHLFPNNVVYMFQIQNGARNKVQNGRQNNFLMDKKGL